VAEKKKINYGKEFAKGILKENPVLRLVLGTCPTLATSTSVVNGVGMGIAATIVLVCSNIAISALRKVIPAKARIPAYIVIIASFVTMVQMLVKAFVPALDESLGVFLPLIVVNCIILGRAEAFAGKNPVLASAVDGLGMGIGFTAALFCMGAVREILGAGTFLAGIDTMIGGFVDLNGFTGFDFTEGLASLGMVPMTIFILPAGGFFTFGVIMALANRLADRKGMPKAELRGCEGCPHAAVCGRSECAAETTAAAASAAPADRKEADAQ
jgi:electron transport complex protein RnfE